MNPQEITMENLYQALQNLQQNFTNAQREINGLRAELQGTRNELGHAQAALQHNTGHTPSGPKCRKPESYKGKGSIVSWITHITNYVGSTDPRNALIIAVSYLDGPAHEWWIVFRETDEGKAIQTWPELQPALIKRFDTLNKVKIARDKLAKWKQIKDVPSFNDDFQRIILDIPNISVEEQIDRYTRGLKAYIWKELCTKEYSTLNDAMRDAERVESAHKRLGTKSPRQDPTPRTRTTTTPEPTPMDIGNVQLKKLTPAERDQCRKEGRCFRCRQKGHMASNCPKGRGN